MLKRKNNSRKPGPSRRTSKPKQDLVQARVLSPVKGKDTIKLARTVNAGPYSMTPTTGWQGTGAYDLAFSFSLSTTVVYAGGAIINSWTNPGYTELVNLFQEYRIDEVEVQMFYSNNVSQINNISNLPIISIVYDRDGTAATSSAAFLQYQDLKTIQLGNDRDPSGPVFRFRPVPNELAGTSATVSQIVPTSAPFVSALFPALPHYGMRILYDPVATTSATSVGNLSFYVRYHISARRSN